MTDFLASILGIVLGIAFLLWVNGYHIKHTPTPDQLYGCTVANEAPNGECK